MNKFLEKNKLVFAILLLYTLNALIVVFSAWAINLHRFGLDITISHYIGLRKWTAFMYVIVAGSMAALATVHVIKIKMSVLKKILYILAFACVFGCAVCPMNRDWNNTVSDIHHIFAHTLMYSGAITFLWMLIKPLDKAQRVFGIIAIVYSILFIVLLVITKVGFLNNTVFIWENAIIYLFIVEMALEKNKE
jgi:hypothetical protein